MTKNQARAAGLNSTVTARVSVGTSACFCVIVFQGLNENPQCSIRPAQERTLATTAWLAPHGRFVVVKIWKPDWKFLPEQTIAASREIWFALRWRL